MINKKNLLMDLEKAAELKAQTFRRDKQEISYSYTDIRNFIENFPITSSWIPCDERLPEESFYCLVTIIDTNPMTMEDFENVLPYLVGYDGKQWNNLDGERIPFEVIAWQPTPAPYKLQD